MRAPSGRRGARRLAVQALYQWLVAGGDAASLTSEFLAERAGRGTDEEYFRFLLATGIGESARLDAELAAVLDRAPAEIDPVEHAVLLVGATELRDRNELAVAVVINEAVELAKLFGAANGHRYVNGVLDRLAIRFRGAARG